MAVVAACAEALHFGDVLGVGVAAVAYRAAPPGAPEGGLWTIADCNAALLAWLRAERSEVVGASLHAVFGPEMGEGAPLGGPGGETLHAAEPDRRISVAGRSARLGWRRVGEAWVVTLHALDGPAAAPRGRASPVLDTAAEQARSVAEANWQLLSAAIEAMPGMVLICDDQMRMILWNSAYRDAVFDHDSRLRVGRPMVDLIRENFRAGIFSDAVGGEESFIARRVAQLRNPGAPFEQHLADGRILLVMESKTPSGGLVSLRFDITDRRRNEQRLATYAAELMQARDEAEAAKGHFGTAVETMPGGILMCDADMRVLVWNRAYRETVHDPENTLRRGMLYEDVLRANLAHGVFVDAIGREDAFLAERLERVRNPGREPMIQTLSDGRVIELFERRTPDGGFVSLRVDVTERSQDQRRLQEYAAALEAARDEIQDQALRDAMTGLSNRRHFDRRLAELSRERAQRAQIGLHVSEMAALHIDLDRFKQINDTLGHAAGDHVLVEVAKVLREETRATDFIARIGGDEFCMLCESVSSRAAVEAIADRIIRRLSAPILFEGRPCRLGASIGVAYCENGGIAPSDLVVHADLALYDAKRAGRNCQRVFSPALQSQAVEKRKLSDEIIDGLERDAFFPVFQPQVSATRRDLVGIEALARWRRADGAIAEPAIFLDVAEDLGLVDRIDDVILRKALEDVAWLEAEGRQPPRLAVNVGYHRLLQSDLVEQVKALAPRGRPLSFELLETILIDDDLSDVVAWNIEQLKALGVEIEIDDFGSGHASIVAVSAIAPHRIKIDKRLVASVVGSEPDQRIIRSIIEIGRTLGVGVIAEGVETEAHAAVLRDLGCDILQGYHFAQPMPRDQLSDYLARFDPMAAAG